MHVIGTKRDQLLAATTLAATQKQQQSTMATPSFHSAQPVSAGPASDSTPQPAVKASITTKRGDHGQTDLYNGDRVQKTDARIEALGQLDSVQSIVGKLYAEMEQLVGQSPEQTLIDDDDDNNDNGEIGSTEVSSAVAKRHALQYQLQVLHDVLKALHDAMASVATPPLRSGSGAPTDPKRLKRATFDTTLVTTLEEQSHAMEKWLPKLREFILPISVYSVHVARTQVRTAERWVLRVDAEAPGTVDQAVRRFLNRFSDYLFILARFLSD